MPGILWYQHHFSYITLSKLRDVLKGATFTYPATVDHCTPEDFYCKMGVSVSQVADLRKIII